MPLSIPLFRRRQAAPIGAAARVVAQRAPETLILVRRRAQPAAVTIARLTGTAVFAYLLALLLPSSTSRPVLAPLTALLVAQVSLYQTVRSAVRKVGSVVAGVLLAVALSALIGFTWWSLGITIAIALVLGHALRLGSDHVLEVPISAMLILSVGTRAAATGRIVETAVGTLAGLLAGLVLASPQVQSAEEAVEELCGTLAALLDRVAAGLSQGAVTDAAEDWLNQARSFSGEIRRVDDALTQAEESLRLNPRSLRLPDATITLRESLETLEHEAITIRILARSLADSIRLAGADSPLHDPDARHVLARVLQEISAAVLTYGKLATAQDPARREVLEAELERQLDAAQRQQDRLSGLIGTDPADQPVGWPLRGELISDLDRLRLELRSGKPDQPVRRRRRPSWRRPPRAPRLLWRPPPRRRITR